MPTPLRSESKAEDKNVPLLAEYQDHKIADEDKSVAYEPLNAIQSASDNVEEEIDYFVVLPNSPTHFPHELPFKVQAFLQQTGVTVEQLQQAGIPFATLNALLNQSYSGRILRWLALESLITKITLFPVLDERGVQHTEIKTKGYGCIAPLLEWAEARTWPIARALPFKSESMLKRAYGIDSFYDGVDTVITKAWSFLLASFIIDDLHYYFKPGPYLRPVLKNIFTGGTANEEALVTFLSRPDHWYAATTFVGVPLLWGIVQVLQANCTRTKALDEKTLENMRQVFKNHPSSVYWDVAHWLSPVNEMRNTLNATRRTLLWDNRLTAQQRVTLFNDFKQFARHTQKITQQHCLEILRDIADGIAMQDFVRLHRLDVEPEILESMLVIKTQALIELQRLAHDYQLPAEHREQSRYARWLAPLTRYLAAHYLLWCLGQPQSKWLQPLFWAFKAANLYVKVNFALLIYTGIRHAIRFYHNKNACLNAGKLWSFINAINDYNCTTCADLPVPYLRSFTMQDCLDNYLLAPRAPDQIIQLIQRTTSHDNVTLLDLSNQQFPDSGNENNLTQLMPAVQRWIPQLQTLSFTGSHDGSSNIGPIGVETLALVLPHSNLRVLDLSFNNIGNNGTQVLALALPRLNLQVLGLSGNNIGDEGAQILAQALPHSTLQSLYLDSNNIGDNGIQALALTLSHSTTLQSLGLSFNSIGENAMQALALALAHSALQSLSLGGNNIGDNSTQALALALPYSNLQVLELGGNNIGDEGAEALAQALPHSTLQSLYLDSNNIGDNGVQALAQALLHSTLQSLTLSSYNISDNGLQALALVLPQSTNLRVLELGGNNIGDEGAEALALALAHSALQSLSLGGNNIGDNGTQALALALPYSNLQSFQLNGNFGDNGLQALALTLPHSALLQSLSLRGYNTGDNGLQTFAFNLTHSALQSLDLSFNNIGDNDARALALALPHSVLQALYLDYNNIGDEGVEALALALPYSALQSFSLENNNFGNNGTQAFALALPHSALKMLDLRSNNIGDVGALAIAHALVTTPKFKPPLWLNFLYSNDRPALAHPQATTALTNLQLGGNNINNTGARALCQQLPWTGISSANLELIDNPVNDPSIFSNGHCVISAASSLRPPLPLRLFYRFTQLTLQPIQATYLHVQDWLAKSVISTSTAKILEVNEKQENEMDEEMQFSFTSEYPPHASYSSALLLQMNDYLANSSAFSMSTTSLPLTLPRDADASLARHTLFSTYDKGIVQSSISSSTIMPFFVAVVLLGMLYRLLQGTMQGVNELLSSHREEKNASSSSTKSSGFNFLTRWSPRLFVAPRTTRTGDSLGSSTPNRLVNNSVQQDNNEQKQFCLR